MSRIDTTFDKLKQQQRKALIPFITAGDPSQQLTVPLMHGLVAAGADVLDDCCHGGGALLPVELCCAPLGPSPSSAISAEYSLSILACASDVTR